MSQCLTHKPSKNGAETMLEAKTRLNRILFSYYTEIHTYHIAEGVDVYSANTQVLVLACPTSSAFKIRLLIVHH